MTMKQRKRVRAAVLVLMFLMLAIGTFDSQHGYLAARAESNDIALEETGDLQTAQNTLPSTRPAKDLAPDSAPDLAPKGIVKTAGIPEADEPAVVVDDSPTFQNEKPASEPGEKPNNNQDGSYHDEKTDPAPESEPQPDSDPEPDTFAGQNPGDDPDPGDKTPSDVKRDRNRGHGNDEDNFDEDNPGQGDSGCVKSFKRRKGHRRSHSMRSTKRHGRQKASVSRRARGKCRGRGGSKRK